MVLSALLGAVFGSFLNVVIYRLPLGMSLALPPSHCPVCGEKLKWYHNIPVLSYISSEVNVPSVKPVFLRGIFSWNC